MEGVSYDLLVDSLMGVVGTLLVVGVAYLDKQLGVLRVGEGGVLRRLKEGRRGAWMLASCLRLSLRFLLLVRVIRLGL